MSAAQTGMSVPPKGEVIFYIFLIDDKKARNEAKEFGFEVRYTSAIIKWAAKRGFIDSYSRIANELKRMKIYLPEE